MNHLQALVNNELWFSLGSAFNDPFDSKPPLFLASTDSLTKFIKSKTKTGIFFTEEEIVNHSNHLLEQYKNGEPIKALFDDLASPIMSVSANTFILCFSKTYKNPLTWSHYSNSHSGFCIRYDLEKLLPNLILITHGAVNYDNQIKDIFRDLDLDKSQEFVLSILMQKSVDWSYEEEYRFILKDDSNSINNAFKCINHNKNAVDGIFFGLQSSERDRNFLINSLAGREIEYFYMNKSTSKFELFETPI